MISKSMLIILNLDLACNCYSRFQFAFEKSLRMFVCKFGMFVAKL